jgi:hypothetical protein
MVAVECGGANNQNSSAKNGGTVTILDSQGGVDSLDPGYWYYQTDYEELGQTTQRQLYGWKPDDTAPSPDLATSLPQVSDGAAGSATSWTHRRCSTPSFNGKNIVPAGNTNTAEVNSRLDSATSVTDPGT